jgi:hypothetical protein
MRTSVAAALLSLLIVPTAFAGGYATVGIDEVPTSAAAGGSWTPQIRVLQHGRTPTDGLRPQVLLTSGDRVERFTARPTGQPGVYQARVTFPAGGRWRVSVDEGFGAVRHQFGSIAIATGESTAEVAREARGPVAPASADDDSLATPLLAAGIAGVLAAALTILLTAAIERRRAARPLAEGGPSPAS